MRRWSITLLLCMLPYFAHAAEPQPFAINTPTAPVRSDPPVQIIIDGPDIVTAGKPVAFGVRGLDPVTLPLAKVIYFPREDVMCVPAQTWGGTTIIWFTPGSAAEYFLAIYTPTGYVEKIIQTKGAPPPPNPGPVPPPDPTPPPIPSGDLLVIVLHESGDTTPQRALGLIGLQEYCLANEQIKVYRCLDKDSLGMDGKPLPWLQGYIRTAKEKGVALPALMVGVLSSSPDKPLANLYAEPLPGNGADMVQVVKKYGG